jgi:O-antigen/teichoic acid export membrane protein
MGWVWRGAERRWLMELARLYCTAGVRTRSPQELGAEAGGGPSGYGLTAKLARGSISASVVFVAGAGVTYCAQLAVARTAGAHGYGVYVYVFAWVTILAYASALGFDISLMRFVPAYLTTRAYAQLRGVIQYAWRRVAALGCGIGLTGVAVILARSGKLPPDLAATFVVGFAVVPVLALLWISAAVVRGFGGVVSALAPDRVVRDGVLLGLILIAGAGAGWSIDAPRAMTATLLGAAAGLGLVSVAMHRVRPDALSSVAPAYDAQTWRRTALPLVIIGTADIMMNRMGVVLLGWTVDPKEAGIYALAFNIAFVVMLPRTAVNALLAPTISDLFVRDNHAALRAIVAKASLWMLLGAACIALPLLVLAEPVLSLFGRDFVAGATALRILLIGQVIVAAGGSQLHLLTMTGHERNAAVQLVASVAANAAVGAALVIRLGPTGAALAATAALIGWNTAMGLSIRRHLRLFPGVFADWPKEAPHTAQRGAAE